MKDSTRYSEISFFDHTELIREIEQITRQFPFLEHRCLGSSILGRSIPMLVIGTGPREVLYVGAHHGMEWITSMVLCRFLRELCQVYQRKGAIAHISIEALLQTHTLYIIPMLNPDGVDYQIHGITNENPLYERLLDMNGGSTDFSKWQANARGVDLNHNYDSGFWEYKKLEAEHQIFQGAPTRFSGESPESEPETAALCNFIRFQSKIRGILTLHTQGEEIFYKSGGKEAKGSRAIAQRLSALTSYRLSEAAGLASFGGLTDWCVQRLDLPSFTLECGIGVNPLPLSQFSSIYTALRNALFAFPTWL